jgi:hypothetical protein
MLHKYIYREYQEVKSIKDTKDGYICADKQGNIISIDLAELEDKVKQDIENDKVIAVKEVINSYVTRFINNQIVELGYSSADSIAKYLRPSSKYYEECSKIADWIEYIWDIVENTDNNLDTVKECLKSAQTLNEFEVE